MADPFKDFINNYDFDKSDQERKRERRDELKRRSASGESLFSIVKESIRSAADSLMDLGEAVQDATEAIEERGDYLDGQSDVGRLPPRPSRG